MLDFTSGIREKSYYINELESLRGIAMLLVYLFHVYGIQSGNPPADYSLFFSFISSGNTGVTLFFVLSGFLLSTPFIRNLRDNKPFNIGQYYLARSLRILPLYIIAVVVAIVLTGKVDEGIPALFFQYVGFDLFPYSVVWWTLSTEIQFYILLPIIFLTLKHKQFRWLLIPVFAVWLYLYFSLAINTSNHEHSNIIQKSLFGRLPAFIIGMATAYFYVVHPLSWPNQTSTRLIHSVFLTACLFLLGVVLQHASSLGDESSEMIWHQRHTYEALCWAGIMYSLLSLRPLGKFILVNNFLGTLGKLSYAFYLIHVPVLFFLIYPQKSLLGDSAYLSSIYAYLLPTIAFISSLLLSLISYQLIELPFLKAKQRLSSKSK